MIGQKTPFFPHLSVTLKNICSAFCIRSGAENWDRWTLKTFLQVCPFFYQCTWKKKNITSPRHKICTQQFEITKYLILSLPKGKSCTSLLKIVKLQNAQQSPPFFKSLGYCLKTNKQKTYPEPGAMGYIWLKKRCFLHTRYYLGSYIRFVAERCSVDCNTNVIPKE